MAIALRYAARTNLGLGPKSRNEDSGYAGPHLLVLADGMGGHAAGDVASSMIVGHLAPLDEDSVSTEQAVVLLEKGLRDANASLADAMAEDPSLDGMGSTTIAMLRAGSKLVMAHIGDSRAFLLRDGELTQITKDHSFVQQLVDEGRITREEAAHHPQRSLVTRVMTGSPADEPDLSVREARLGDRYLLCSDGLTDFVGVDIVDEILREASTPEVAADRLISIALKASTRDNVTAVVADVVDASTSPSTVPQVVGAAGMRRPGKSTRALPITPAEKAAALSRSVTGAGPSEDDELTLAEEPATSGRVHIARLGLAALIAAVIIGAGGYAAYGWTQAQYYLGPSADGATVSIYQGVPQSLGPIVLSHSIAPTDVAVTDLPTHYQDVLRGGIPASSRADADARVTALRQVALQCQVMRMQGQQCAVDVTFPSAGASASAGASSLPTVSPTSPTTATVTPLGTTPLGTTPIGTTPPMMSPLSPAGGSAVTTTPGGGVG